MASSVISTATVTYHRNSSLVTSSSTSIHFLASYNCSTSKITSLHRPSLLPSRNSDSRRHRCRAMSPHPPPESGPPPPPDDDDEPDSNPGSIVSFSRFQESVQIFFAVLFWMSLFFWSSVWDGRNNGRSDKGPRFWK